MQVKVYNRNTVDHVEKFKEQVIRIPAGKYVVMDREDAVQFCAQFFRPKFDGNKIQLPSSYKKLEIDGKYSPKSQREHKQTSHKCIVCSEIFESENALDAHAKDAHNDRIAPELSEDDLEDSSEQEFAETIKRGPGRPRKTDVG